MTAFYFAFCMMPDPTMGDLPYRLARCTYVTQQECELVFDECYEGWVKTPLFRRMNDENTDRTSG